jgi:hypothetical protein
MFTFLRSKEAGQNAVVTNPKQTNVDKLQNVRPEASRYIRGKRRNI